MIVCARCPFLLVSSLLSFCAGLEGIGAASRLCGSVIRMGGRESASQQDSLFYIHQKSCLWFAPSLTCDSMDCSTTLLLRKSCTYHPLFHTTRTAPPFSPSLLCCQSHPCLTIKARHCPTIATTSFGLSLRPKQQLINFFIIIDIASLQIIRLAKVIIAQCVPLLIFCSSHFDK